MEHHLIGSLNLAWGKTIISQLVSQGVEYFCLSPGFRSTPLALALSETPQAKTFVHFDERGTVFHALGYAKASKKPVAVIVTSGTAVGNLMPAVMEAKEGQVPLILLTCDRPAELRDTMANQTADQTKIFGSYVHYFFDLPSPRADIPHNFLTTTIAHAVTKSLFPAKGPIQINCPFAEPLFSDHQISFSLSNPTNVFFPKQTIENLDTWAKEWQKIEKGVIVLGNNANTLEAKTLSEKLQWPILPDIISSYRELADERTIPYFHSLLPFFHPEIVLHFGDACVSKKLMQWMSQAPRYIHIAQHDKRCDPYHSVSERIICEPNTFCKELALLLTPKESFWFDQWKDAANQIAFSFPPLSEIGIVQWVEKVAKPGTALFFGNSMPIRDADMFFFPKNPCGPIFANRGLSGIDGNIATIAGISQRMPVIAIIGDQTALHDLNSLAQLTKTNYPVKLIIMNNGGGGIFSFLDIKKRKDVLDPYFAATHHWNFSFAAQMFGLSYTLATTKECLEEKSQMIEVVTHREENVMLHQQFEENSKEKIDVVVKRDNCHTSLN